jgi:hypothetical protein
MQQALGKRKAHADAATDSAGKRARLEKKLLYIGPGSDASFLNPDFEHLWDHAVLIDIAPKTFKRYPGNASVLEEFSKNLATFQKKAGLKKTFKLSKDTPEKTVWRAGNRTVEYYKGIDLHEDLPARVETAARGWTTLYHVGYTMPDARFAKVLKLANKDADVYWIGEDMATLKRLPEQSMSAMKRLNPVIMIAFYIMEESARKLARTDVEQPTKLLGRMEYLDLT